MKISYLELLQMIKEGTQPEKVKYAGKNYSFLENSYAYDYGGIRNYLSEVIARGSFDVRLVTDKVIKCEIDILDDVERKYLSALIKPFRRKVSGIVKRRNDNKYYISIVIDGDVNVCLPYFRDSRMYKKMELSKEYTLEELGL